MKPILALAALLFTTASASSAAIVWGELNIDGERGARVNGTTLDFAPPGGGSGNFEVDSGDGTFAGLEDTDGQILDLNALLAPPGMNVNIPNFLVFNASPVTFDLLRLEQGTFPSTGCGSAAPGAVCTPSTVAFVSPFELANSSQGVSISLSVLALASDGSGDPGTIYRGLFTTQVTSLAGVSGAPTIPQVLAAASQPGGLVAQNSWSATFSPVAVIPEPSTVVLGLAGFALLGIGRFARRSK